MAKSLFLLFNHQFTAAQEADARASLGIECVVNLPDHLQDLWSNIPPDLEEISSYLVPITDWLKSSGNPGDYALIQGDFGACYLMAQVAFSGKMVPIYSTTERSASEELDLDGSIILTHHFQHRIFRRYGR